MIEEATGSESVRLAYDRIAHDYDRQVAGDAWMRSILWREYARLFHAGDRILDVSCGTGLDAVFLARRGIRVTGIDVSPEMIAALRERVASERLDEMIDARVLDHADLNLLPEGSFDGIVSAFAGLNTSSDLARFANNAAKLLRPNGRVVIHMLNRFSLWEWLGLVAHGRLSDAQRLGHDSYRDFTIGDIRVKHTLYSPLHAYRSYFSSEFLLIRAFALGVLRPPHTMRMVPVPVARLLGHVEARISSHRPWLNCGRFFVLELVKRPNDEREP
ncbi:MAG TPA: class I SAM-dependent methyltransferase [Nitrolancea sp.]|jgi:SAM-dependent methyltransferase|nr:class I SAM-dependent methyltransferase [Nitrolancea sp.]